MTIALLACIMHPVSPSLKQVLLETTTHYLHQIYHKVLLVNRYRIYQQLAISQAVAFVCSLTNKTCFTGPISKILKKENLLFCFFVNTVKLTALIRSPMITFSLVGSPQDFDLKKCDT